MEYSDGVSVEDKINELYEKAEQGGKVLGCPKCTKLEYLESTGTQYIDTLIKLNQDSYVEMELQMIDNGLYSHQIFGSRKSATDSSFIAFMSIGFGQFAVDFQTYTPNRLGVSPTYDKVLVKISNQKISIGNIEKNISSYSKFETPDNAYIFHISGSGPFGTKALMKLYYLKINSGNTTVRDYIPVLDKNKRPCLFDKVSKTCFYNQGTGEFLYG